MKGSFPETPLLGFTTLATAGAGLIGARPLLFVARLSPVAAPAPELVWGIALVCLGLFLSLAHLGRPDRLHLALRGVARSAVSNEVLLAVALIVATAVTAALRLRNHEAASSLHIVSGGLALAFLISIGRVYRLPGQQTWSGGVLWAPALLGLALGVAAVAADTSGLEPHGRWVILGLLGVEASLFIRQWSELGHTVRPGTPAHPRLFGQRRRLVILRGVLANAAPTWALLVGRMDLTAAALALGLVVDRFVFYGLAAQHTTEAELERVEAILETLGSAHHPRSSRAVEGRATAAQASD